MNFGVTSAQNSHEIRRIKTVNLINLIMIFFLLIGFTNYFFLKADFTLVYSCIFISLAILSLILNKFQKNNLAFIIFTLNANLSIFFINKIYPIESGAYLFYFPLIVSVVLLNNPSLKDRYSLIHFTVCIVFFVANLVLDVELIHVMNLTAEKIKLLWYYDLIISAIITGVISFLLTRLIHDQNKEILLQNTGLQKAQETVTASLKEKEVLLAELNHRVKNNLAIISGLLSLQESSIHTEDAKKVLHDSRARIMSMALVHKMLYENPELKNIQIAKYSSDLLAELLNSYNITKNYDLKEDYDDIRLPVNKSIPLGLILNEIITNSIKYAFKRGQSEAWVFDISIKQNGGQIILVAKDNGPGFTKDFNLENESHSLGIFLIKTLVEQIEGQVMFSNENGAKISLEFTLN